jgi:hypothetical protein
MPHARGTRDSAARALGRALMPAPVGGQRPIATAAAVATDFPRDRRRRPRPWQRGSNENTNGHLRRYLPRHLSLRDYSQDDLDAIAAELNGRPRQTLGFKTPSAQ